MKYFNQLPNLSLIEKLKVIYNIIEKFKDENGTVICPTFLGHITIVLIVKVPCQNHPFQNATCNSKA
mgnify:CR=1 FL=1